MTLDGSYEPSPAIGTGPRPFLPLPGPCSHPAPDGGAVTEPSEGKRARSATLTAPPPAPPSTHVRGGGERPDPTATTRRLPQSGNAAIWRLSARASVIRPSRASVNIDRDDRIHGLALVRRSRRLAAPSSPKRWHAPRKLKRRKRSREYRQPDVRDWAIAQVSGASRRVCCSSSSASATRHRRSRFTSRQGAV